jgi:hypothetical protein
MRRDSMAEFKSKYSELSFFVEDVAYKFSGGQFSTEDKKVIEVVEKLRDVTRVDAPKAKKAEAKPKAARKTATRKTSEK